MLLTEWFPDHPPIYNIQKSYHANFVEGPAFPMQLSMRPIPPKTQWISFLGQKLISPFGVAAGPLLNAKWIALAAALGFDILVYKTIRSHEHPAHPPPNIRYAHLPGIIPFDHIPQTVTMASHPAHRIEDLVIAYSFGTPSSSPAYLLEDISRAHAPLQEGQLLIVSIMGTENEGRSLLQDFVDAAALARDAGAKVIECNFTKQMLYASPDKILDIGLVLAKAMHPIPLILKVRAFSSSKQMRDVLIAAAKAGIRAISGINGLPMRIEDQKGHPAFSQNRFRGEVCGGPMRNVALHFVEQAYAIIKREKLDLELIGVGGIAKPEHFFHFLERGAQLAMTARGMMWDPYLALRAHAYVEQKKQRAI
jgi:dihydroorotate dehydrogenase